MQEAHDPYLALRQPKFRRLLAANMCANVGVGIMAVAVDWELYERTGSAMALGYVGLVQIVPIVLFALPAGHLADQVSRSSIVVVTQTLMTFATLGLAILAFTHGSVKLDYVCLLLAGISQAFNAPARWSVMPQVVPKEAIANAVIWNSTAWQIATIVGPALGGGIIEYFGGAGAAFLTAGCCTIACAATMATLRLPASHLRQPLTLATFTTGIKFVASSKLILAAITLDLFAVLFGGATALLPIFARDILHVGPTGLGWLKAAPSIGALLMGMALAKLPPFRKAGLALLWAVTGFGVATIIFGISKNYALSIFLLALTGVFDNISVIVRGTLVQILTPDSMRGRVSAVNSIFINSSNHLGTYESGVVAEYFGPVFSVVSGGIGTLAIVFLAIFAWPELLKLGRLQARDDASKEVEQVLPMETTEVQKD